MPNSRADKEKNARMVVNSYFYECAGKNLEVGKV